MGTESGDRRDGHGDGSPTRALLRFLRPFKPNQVPVKWLIPEPIWLSSHLSKDTDAAQTGNRHGGHADGLEQGTVEQFSHPSRRF